MICMGKSRVSPAHPIWNCRTSILTERKAGKMQDDSGLKSVMTLSWVYQQFQNGVGAKRLRKWLSDNCWRLKGGEKVVDIGCGPAVILDFLPRDVQYFGFDISEEYISSARKRFGDRGTFIVGTAEDFEGNPDKRLSGADLVLCNGLLHHLEDVEAVKVLQLSRDILNPAGKLVCMEPTFLVHQGALSKWIMSRDRGQNIRHEKEWKELLGQVFNRFTTNIATGLLRIPYAHIVMECQR